MWTPILENTSQVQIHRICLHCRRAQRDAKKTIDEASERFGANPMKPITGTRQSSQSQLEIAGTSAMAGARACNYAFTVPCHWWAEEGMQACCIAHESARRHARKPKQTRANTHIGLSTRRRTPTHVPGLLWTLNRSNAVVFDGSLFVMVAAAVAQAAYAFFA